VGGLKTRPLVLEEGDRVLLDVRLLLLLLLLKPSRCKSGSIALLHLQAQDRRVVHDSRHLVSAASPLRLGLVPLELLLDSSEV
jgi:hypothetical protein